MTDSVLDLKSLLSESKGTSIDFPGMPGFVLNLAFLSRQTLASIRKKATTATRKRGELIETVNDELFLQLYSDAAIKGWSGLKFSYLRLLAPVTLQEGADDEKTLAFSKDNALLLMKSSADFDSFVSDTVTDLANFQSASGTKSLGN